MSSIAGSGADGGTFRLAFTMNLTDRCSLPVTGTNRLSPSKLETSGQITPAESSRIAPS
jgi:hypothetical protein